MTKGLETIYNGFRCRSRTEARWMVFFDSIGVKFLYENEDFLLSNGKRYLPDFYLPELNGGVYAEVKGVFKEHEKLTCALLSELTGRPVLMLEGVPDFKHFRVYCGDYQQLFYGAFYPIEDRIWWEDFLEGEKECLDPGIWCYLEDAIMASRAARFENFALPFKNI